jgi:erythromycin esterase-like protein
VREQHGGDGVFLVGFGSHRGSVIAAKDWEARMEKMTVPPGREGSWENVLHRAGAADKLLLLEEVRDTNDFLTERGHRAIGVVYHPEYDHLGNYVPTVLPRRYDAFCYFDVTHALHPLHLRPALEKMPETYPWGV